MFWANRRATAADVRSAKMVRASMAGFSQSSPNLHRNTSAGREITERLFFSLSSGTILPLRIEMPRWPGSVSDPTNGKSRRRQNRNLANTHLRPDFSLPAGCSAYKHPGPLGFIRPLSRFMCPFSQNCWLTSSPPIRGSIMSRDRPTGRRM